MLQYHFFESILIVDGKIPLVNEHYLRISDISRVLECKLNFGIDKFTTTILEQLTQPIGYFKCRIFLSINNRELVIEKMEWEAINKEDINPIRAISLCIYPSETKKFSPLSKFKQPSKFLYQESLKYAQKLNCEQAIILNEKQEIVETSTCNIYIVKGKKIYTPFLTSGAVGGVVRQLLIQHSEVEEKILTISDMETADEIFLSNAVRGIILVGRWGKRLYTHTYSTAIQKQITHKMRGL